MKKHYYSVQHDAALIASEILQSGKSSGWAALNDQDFKVAEETESMLAAYNIGYTDDMLGEWKHKQGGSKFFAVRSGFKSAKDKLSSLKSIFGK